MAEEGSVNRLRKEREERMKAAIGQDSHRFDFSGSEKPLILGGIVFEGEPPLLANSDGDVVLHAVCRAISGITTIDVLGPKTKIFLSGGITDSKIYVEEALKDLEGIITHISISIECKHPHITPRIPEMRSSLSNLLHIDGKNIGITATSGEDLTEAGRGNGISVFVVISVE